MASTSSDGNSRKDTLIGCSVLLVALLLVIFVIWWLVRLGGAVVRWGASLSPHSWSVIGDILRNTSGLLALIGAAAAVTVAWTTNKSRAREAAGAEFRQHLQWCVEKLAQEDADYMEKLFALSILDRYGTMKDRRLPKKDRQIAALINDLEQRLHAPKDADEIDDFDQEKPG